MIQETLEYLLSDDFKISNFDLAQFGIEFRDLLAALEEDYSQRLGGYESFVPFFAALLSRMTSCKTFRAIMKESGVVSVFVQDENLSYIIKYLGNYRSPIPINTYLMEWLSSDLESLFRNAWDSLFQIRNFISVFAEKDPLYYLNLNSGGIDIMVKPRGQSGSKREALRLLYKDFAVTAFLTERVDKWVPIFRRSYWSSEDILQSVTKYVDLKSSMKSAKLFLFQRLPRKRKIY